MKKSNMTHKLAAAVTAGAMLSTSVEAFAGNATNFSTMTGNIATASNGLPKMISMVGYIGGSALAVAGVFKIKAHTDNPGQTPLKDGLARLGCGGALLALPFITNAMQGSISDGVASGASITVLEGTSQFGAQ